jgi:hypothetical protein
VAVIVLGTELSVERDRERMQVSTIAQRQAVQLIDKEGMMGMLNGILTQALMCER